MLQMGIRSRQGRESLEELTSEVSRMRRIISALDSQVAVLDVS